MLRSRSALTSALLGRTDEDKIQKLVCVHRSLLGWSAGSTLAAVAAIVPLWLCQQWLLYAHTLCDAIAAIRLMLSCAPVDKPLQWAQVKYACDVALWPEALQGIAVYPRKVDQSRVFSCSRPSER